jgi:DNA-binding FadR family transcriptional regulator
VPLKAKSTIDGAAARLRKIALSKAAGARLGSEERLIARLGVSRATVRQVARLLEREGMLQVRRGLNGGYFAARPDLGTIEATVSAYLEMLHTEPEDLTIIASALWVEVLRKAARISSKAARTLAGKYLDRIKALRPSASFDDVLQLEQAYRSAIFALINSRYIELVFQINTAYALRYFPNAPSEHNDTEAHREFVRAWRSAKLLELESILHGDPELASTAARHSRNLWHRRIWNHDRP